jgi:hypothetical protein
MDDFRTSTDVYKFCDDFLALESGASTVIQPLAISKIKLIQSSYNYRNAFSRAVLAFLAGLEPRDFEDEHAQVLDNVYLLLSQAPNLHHICPENFLEEHVTLPRDLSPHSLMNICFLRARTNTRISDTNPFEYLKKFASVRNFDEILKSHLIRCEWLDRESFTSEDYRVFLVARASWFAETLQQALPDVEVTIVD